MKTTRLGKTGLEVSRIAFGTWQVSGEWGSYDAEQAQRAIRHALDREPQEVRLSSDAWVARTSWDKTWQQMQELMNRTRAGKRGAQENK